MDKRSFMALLVSSASLWGLGGCQTLDRLADVGELPSMTHIENPEGHPNHRPVTMPMPEGRMDANEESVRQASRNSLWQVGARSFFRDQRASRVGDILTVAIDINEKAELSNSSNRNRNSSEKVGIDNFLGLENNLPNFLPTGVDPKKLIGISSNPTHVGQGTIKRKETVQTKVAASIIQILPNGNFVIQGRQELRINYEIRELILKGIVRPSDISSDNSVPLRKIAEARLSYGGRGQIDDMQQPPLGQQVVDLISPI